MRGVVCLHGSGRRCAAWFEHMATVLVFPCCSFDMLAHLPKRVTVAMVPGDGIGPEISAAVKKIFAAAKVSLPHNDYRARQCSHWLCGGGSCKPRPPSTGKTWM
jgi:hypothetical protein